METKIRERTAGHHLLTRDALLGGSTWDCGKTCEGERVGGWKGRVGEHFPKTSATSAALEANKR